MDDDARSAAHTLADQSSRPAYAPPSPHVPKKSHTRMWLIIGSIVALGVISLLLWYFLLRADTPADPQSDTTQTTATNTVTPNTDVAESSATETYQSSALSVAFKYPTTWKVSEANGGIRVESASFMYPSKYQGEVSGNFRIYIRQGARKVDGTYIGRGYAVKPSEKLVYTQPAVGQRSETLLSSFGYDTTDNFAFFLIAGNFQLSTGDTLGPNYGTEVDTYIITGGYASPTAVDDLAAVPVGLSYYQTTKAYRQALVILGSLQLK